MGEELVHRNNRRNPRQRRQVVGRIFTPIQWPLIAAALIALVLIARDWSLAELGIEEILLLTSLAVLCVAPLWRWYRLGMHWIPLGESYVAMHVIYYVLPCLAGRADWLIYPEPHRVLVLLALGVFLTAFMVSYGTFCGGSNSSLNPTSLLRREAGQGIMWAFFIVWLGWSVLLQSHLLPNLGGLLNVFRSLATAGGTVGVIFLFYQLGKRRFSDRQRFYLLAGFLTGLAVDFTSGFLNGAAELIGAALLAFTLGRKQVPVKAVALSVVVLVVLNLGKTDYRTAYWGEGKNFSEQKIGLVAGYETWLKASWKNLLQGNEPGDEQHGLLERTSLVHMLGQVMEDTPAQQPFLFGKTYGMLPELLVPRVFWPDKPRGTLPSETLCIHYGIQTTESVEITGVCVGPVAEAWANFGWFGLVAAGAFLGMLFGLPARVTRTLEPHQIGWLLASIFLLYATDLEHCIAETCCSLLTALLMGVILLFAISRAIASPRPGRRYGRPVAQPAAAADAGDSLPG